MLTNCQLREAIDRVTHGAQDRRLFRSIAGTFDGLATDKLLVAMLSETSDPNVASWLFTSLFYHGYTLGLGGYAEKWVGLESTGSLGIMLPAILEKSCIVGGDVTAFRALMGVRPRHYDLDLQDAQRGVLETFGNGLFLRALSTGELWEGGRFLRDQITGSLERRASPAVLIIYLKAFAGDASVRQFLIDQLSGDCAAEAFGILVNYFDYCPEPAAAVSAVRDESEAIFVANAALKVAAKTKNADYVDLARHCAKRFGNVAIEECIERAGS